MNTCTRLSGAGLFMAALAFLAAAPPASATQIFFVVDQGTANAYTTVLVDDDAVADQIQFTVNVLPDPDNGNIGDITGLWMNLTPYPLPGLTDANFAGAELTGVLIGAGNDVDQAGCNNMQGTGPYDVGLSINGCGSSGGLLLSTIVTMDDTYGGTTLTALSFLSFGVRLQSVGDDPVSGGGDSAKLFGDDPICIAGCDPPGDVTDTPEPSTFALFGAGLVAVGLIRRRYVR